MELSYNELCLLSRIYPETGGSQRALAEKTGFSLGKVNNTIQSLREKQLVDALHITENGLRELERYRVQNAILIASDRNSDAAPMELTEVKGEILIERLICQLHSAGIADITVLIRHRPEKYFYLHEKFGVRLVVAAVSGPQENAESLCSVSALLGRSYICRADMYFEDVPFSLFEYGSFCYAVNMNGFQPGLTGLRTERNGAVKEAVHPAADMPCIYGCAYFDDVFSVHFQELLRLYYDASYPGIFSWEEIYAEHTDSLPLRCRILDAARLCLLDTPAAAEQFDPEYYLRNNTSAIQNICSVLQCEPSDIRNFRILDRGLTNRSFRFDFRDTQYIYRHPGIGTENYINRNREYMAQTLAGKLGIDTSFIAESRENGWKLSYFITADETFDFENSVHLRLLSERLHLIHTAGARCGVRFDYMEEASHLLERINVIDTGLYLNLISLYDRFDAIGKHLEADNWPHLLTHNGINEGNILLSHGKLCLIDWEHAGDADIGYDICKLFARNGTMPDKIDEKLALYYGRMPSEDEHRHLCGCAAVYYFHSLVWAAYMLARGEDYARCMLNYYEKLELYADEYRREQ